MKKSPETRDVETRNARFRLLPCSVREQRLGFFTASYSILFAVPNAERHSRDHPSHIKTDFQRRTRARASPNPISPISRYRAKRKVKSKHRLYDRFERESLRLPKLLSEIRNKHTPAFATRAISLRDARHQTARTL